MLKDVHCDTVYKCKWFDGLKNFTPLCEVIPGEDVLIFDKTYYCNYNTNILSFDIDRLNTLLDNVRGNSKEDR